MYPKFDSCLLCGSIHLLDLKDYSADFLVKCQDCGFVFCDRKPSFEELMTHYNDYPLNKSLSPITLNRYEELCKMFNAFRKTNNILDIGCGDGHFLGVAKRNGWNVYGTEFTDRATQVGINKGIHIFKGDLSGLELKDEFFDIITSFEVLEHINNPNQEAAKIAKLLRPGGVLYVTTPNFNSFSRTLLGPKWNIIEYPEHLCYYTKRTLISLFMSYDFAPLRITATGISLDRFKKKFSTSAANDSIRVDETVRKKIDENRFLVFLKHAINACLNVLNKGDALKASFIKK